MNAIEGATEHQQSEMVLRQVLEAAPDAMVTTEHDGKIVLVNSRVEQLFGYSRQELIGQAIEMLVPERFHATHMRHHRGAVAAGEPRSIEASLELFWRRKDGAEFLAETRVSALHAPDGQVLVTSAIRNISKRNAEMAHSSLASEIAASAASEDPQQSLADLLATVRGSEVQFRATFEQAAVGMAHVALDGRWLRVNQRLCDIVGYSKDELLECTFQDITHPDDLDTDLEHVQQLLAGSIDTYTLDKRYVRKGGSAVWIALTVSLVRHEDGSPHYFISVIQDISTRRQAEDQLGRQATQQAVLAEAGLVLSRSLDYEATLSQVARLAVPLLGDWCTVYLREDAETRAPAIRRVAAAHADPAKQSLLEEMGDLVPVNESAPVGVPRVIRTGRPQLVGQIKRGELENVARSPEHWRLFQALGSVQSMLTVPLIAAGETLGAMVFVSVDPARRHTPREQTLALDLAGRCAQAIHNARLYRARQAAEARIAAEAARAHVLAEASQAFAAANLNTRTLVEVIAACIGRALGDTCVVQAQPAEGSLHAPVGVYHPRAVEAEALQTELANATALFEEELALDVAGGHAVRLVGVTAAGQYPGFSPGLAAVLRRLGAHNIAAVPLRVATDLLGMAGVWRDQPGRAHDETDLLLLQDLADRAALALEAARRFEQSLAAIHVRDDVLAAVSHDLKTPLTAILGNAQMVQQLLGVAELNPERLGRSVDRIVSGSRRMADMMDELVDAARLEAGQTLVLHRVRMDIAALARTIVADQQITATAHAIHASGWQELSGIWDPARLRRVLENLIGNAIKYSPDGGDVHVEISREDSDSGAWAVVRVSDQGIGIPPADVPHLFERFRRARNVTQIAGTGLGLSGAKQIIEQHGGSLEVASEEGVGSIFTIRLPLVGPMHSETSR